MTFKEKLKQDEPESVDDYYCGGCRSCPYAYGYEKITERPCIEKVKYDERIPPSFCSDCWGREMP